MGTKPKNPKQLERHFKGVANHWRLRILLLVADTGGISLDGIVVALDGNVKTIAEHTRRLYLAGLIDKKYLGRAVIHTLSPYGRTFHKFITIFQAQP